MTRFLVTACCALAVVGASGVAAADESPSAAQIVEKNVAARGGAAAWRAVQTLKFEGEMDAGGKPPHTLPFVLREKRPHKSRLEISFRDQAAVQVFDGAQGWKWRPYLNRAEVEAFSAEEVKEAASADDLDGPLIDHAAKGTQVALVGKDTVEGHPTWKLALTAKSGAKRNLWVDAGTYLEVKMDGEPRKLDGKVHSTAIFFRDYRAEHGLVIPHLQETTVVGTKFPAAKMTIAKVAVNEAMEETLFQKPQAVMTPPAAPPAADAAAAPAPVAKPAGKPAAKPSAPPAPKQP